MRILVIEDEPKTAAYLKKGLEESGYSVEVANDGSHGLILAQEEDYDVIILDVMLPWMDGWTVVKTLRATRTTPVLFLTARDDVDDRVRGLELGADDYLVKPFAFAELLARVRALIRRGRGDQLLHLSVADLVIDVGAHAVSRGGRRVELTNREYELLEYLVRHKGTLVSREMLARDVWGETQRCTPLDNVIDVHIARLRKRIDQEPAVRLIHTVRGVGFIVREGEA